MKLFKTKGSKIMVIRKKDKEQHKKTTHEIISMVRLV